MFQPILGLGDISGVEPVSIHIIPALYIDLTARAA
jgi:hypothetical protein